MSSVEKNAPKAIDYCFVCKELSSLKCSNCVKIFYCSAKHQRQDWKRHKHECRPFEIAVNEKFGRYLITTRDIRQGEIILKESPLIRGPSQITMPVCIYCLEGLEESDINIDQVCEKCGWPMCLNCKNDKNISNVQHDECEITVARGTKFNLHNYSNPHPTYQCLTVLRCLLLKEHSPEKWKKLIQLESHCNERRGSQQWYNDREGVARFIPRFFKCPGQWDENEILKVAGIIQINGHEVVLTEPAHVAIYNLSSLVQHSCSPNLTKSFTSKADLMLWAPNPIKKGEHLSISYSDALWGTANRQNHLLQTKMFRCDCFRCNDCTEFGTNFSAIKCNAANACNGLMLPKNPNQWDDQWKCNTCNNIVEQSYIRSILDRASSEHDGMDKSDVKQCLKFIDHYSQWLSSNHYYICDVELTLTQAIGSPDPKNLQSVSNEELHMKISLCRKLLRLFEVLAAAESRCLGALHFELHAALAELGRRAMKNKDNCFRKAIEDSLKSAEETVRYLQHEPIELSEGQICAQTRANIESLRVILASTATSDI